MNDRSTDRRLTDGYLVGWFRWDLLTDQWEWSEGMYQIHRMDPGEIKPTREVLLAHKHPDDRPSSKRSSIRRRSMGSPTATATG